MSGSERQLALLIDALDRRLYDPVVVETSASTLRDSDRQQIELLPWRKLRNVFARYRCAKRLLDYAREQRVNLIHCSYQWLMPYAIYLSRKMSIPLVLHVRRPGSSAAKAVRHGFTSADAIIAISARIERELRQSSRLRDKVRRIDDAVAPEFFDPPAKTPQSQSCSDDTTVVFGMAGRIEPNKHQLAFLRAAHALKQKGVRARFEIIGPVDDPIYHRELQDYITRAQLGSCASLVGERQDMASALHSIDVLVSLAGGSVMYEAMACGKPVLSAGLTHPRNAVHVRNGETGLVIDSRAPDDVARACEQLLDRRMRQHLGQNARLWAETHFASKVLARKTEEVYNTVLGPRA